jgi:hypothetical protein
MHAVHLEDAHEAHGNGVKRNGLKWAEAYLRERNGETAEQLKAEFRKRVSEPLRNTRGLIAKNPDDWYAPRADHDSPRWAYARARIGRPDDVVEKTNEVADQTVTRAAFCHNRAPMHAVIRHWHGAALSAPGWVRRIFTSCRPSNDLLKYSNLCSRHNENTASAVVNSPMPFRAARSN